MWSKLEHSLARCGTVTGFGDGRAFGAIDFFLVKGEPSSVFEKRSRKSSVRPLRSGHAEKDRLTF
jgi:hypothetical protein